MVLRIYIFTEGKSDLKSWEIMQLYVWVQSLSLCGLEFYASKISPLNVNYMFQIHHPHCYYSPPKCDHYNVMSIIITSYV